MDVGLKIERLNGTNYPNWKFKVRMLLTRDDLWEVVSGLEVVGENATPAERLAWRKKDNRALSTICLLVDDSQLNHVKKAESSTKAWLALQQHFEKPSLSNKLFLRKRLLGLRLERSGDMQSHINQVVDTAEELRSAGENMSDADIVTTLLCSLHDGYESLITALESRKEEDLTLEFVKSRLLHESAKQDQSRGKEESALKASKFDKRQFNEKKKFQRRCFICNKPDHMKKDCPHRVKEDKKTSNSQSSSTNSASAKFSSVEYCFSVSSGAIDRGVWYIDSGCTNHMSSNEDWFINMQSCNVRVSVADDRKVVATGRGSVKFDIVSDGIVRKIELKDVLFVPELQGNLFSVSSATRKGFCIQFSSEKCSIIANSKVIMSAYRFNGLYHLQVKNETALFAASSKNSYTAWHRRFGHVSEKYIKSTIGDLSEKEAKICEACVIGKMARLPFPKKSARLTSRPLELIHSDVCGPMQTESLGKKRYFLTFIDDFSRFTYVYLIRRKSEVIEKFQEYKKLVENQTNYKISAIRFDGGGEYSSSDFSEIFKRNGIRVEKTAPYTPQQNGVAERFNRSIVEMARAMINDANLAIGQKQLQPQRI